MLKQNKQFFYALVAGVLLAAPLAVQARGLVPCGGPTERACNVDDVFGFIARVITLLVSLAGVWAVVFIVKSGFGLVFSQGDTAAVTANRKGLTNAVIGFVLVMLSFVMINTIVRVLDIKDCQGNRFNLAQPQTYLVVCR